MTPEAISFYFSPLMYIFYLGTILVIMIGYYQWKWSKVCRTSVQVLIIKSDGHGDYALAPQSGGTVELKDPQNNTTRLWPMNKLSTVDVPYPGSGFVPGFLQKTIRMVVVDEEDWEPILNRGPYKERVASPDVIRFLSGLADSDPKQGDAIREFASSLSSASTREMIASPAFLGNLTNEKITEAVVTVNKEMFERIEGIIRHLGSVLRSNTFFIGIGLVIVALIFMAYQIIPMKSDVTLIKESLGIAPTATVKPKP